MSKTAVQKDRLPFQFEGAATSFGVLAPMPKPSYVPINHDRRPYMSLELDGY